MIIGKENTCSYIQWNQMYKSYSVS